MSDFGNVVERKCRKDYRCEWCGGKILKGEVCAHFTGVWESEFQNWRMHRECYVASCKTNDLIDGFTPYSYVRGGTEER